MTIENPLRKESEFDRLLNGKRAEEWHFMGREGLAKTKFQDGKFLEIPYQTEDSIKEKYLQMARNEDLSHVYEVDLVLDKNTEKLTGLREVSTDEEFQNILSNLEEKDRAYFVFMRKVKK